MDAEMAELGRRFRLKIWWAEGSVRVRAPLSVQQLFDYATRTITAYARMRRDDRQVIVNKTTVGNDEQTEKFYPDTYLQAHIAKRVSFFIKIF